MGVEFAKDKFDWKLKEMLCDASINVFRNMC